jgi:hypothetical protein
MSDAVEDTYEMRMRFTKSGDTVTGRENNGAHKVQRITTHCEHQAVQSDFQVG